MVISRPISKHDITPDVLLLICLNKIPQVRGSMALKRFSLSSGFFNSIRSTYKCSSGLEETGAWFSRGQAALPKCKQDRVLPIQSVGVCCDALGHPLRSTLDTLAQGMVRTNPKGILDLVIARAPASNQVSGTCPLSGRPSTQQTPVETRAFLTKSGDATHGVHESWT